MYPTRLLQTQLPSAIARMTQNTPWNRLVRYESARDGIIKYGEPIVPGHNSDLDKLAASGKLRVKVLEGPTLFQVKHNGQEDEVGKLLGPLTPQDVPIVRCIGLNYKSHSRPSPASRWRKETLSLTLEQSSKPASISQRTQHFSPSQDPQSQTPAAPFRSRLLDSSSAITRASLPSS
jgi:hypothetical protein